VPLHREPVILPAINQNVLLLQGGRHASFTGKTLNLLQSYQELSPLCVHVLFLSEITIKMQKLHIGESVIIRKGSL